LVGEEVIIQKRDRWFSEFKKLDKGKSKRPYGFTTYTRKFTQQLSSETSGQKQMDREDVVIGENLSSPTIRLWASKDALPTS